MLVVDNFWIVFPDGFESTFTIEFIEESFVVAEGYSILWNFNFLSLIFISMFLNFLLGNVLFFHTNPRNTIYFQLINSNWLYFIL